MRIVLSGSTGMIGESLVAFFKAQGHEVFRLVRGESEYNDPSPVIRWDISSGMIESDKLEGMDVIIHLAGASIAGQRWTDAYKRTIKDSRVKSTQLLAKTIEELNEKPKVFISASAIGYYGFDAGTKTVDESSDPGKDFLANVCRQWEQATKPVEEAGVRTICLRIGVVLGLGGGALTKMLPIFKKGLGGPIASGDQMMSWIHVAEFAPLCDYLIQHEEITGPVNACSPNAVTNKEFTQTLARAIKKPAFLPVPAFVLRLLYGEMADALLVNGANVVPKKLTDHGYVFQHPQLKQALESFF